MCFRVRNGFDYAVALTRFSLAHSNGPRDNGDGRPSYLPPALHSSMIYTGTTMASTTTDFTYPADSTEATTPTLEAPIHKSLPTPPHLLPILKLLRGNRSAVHRSRSQPQRDLNSFSSNARSCRLLFFRDHQLALPLIESTVLYDGTV